MLKRTITVIVSAILLAGCSASQTVPSASEEKQPEENTEIIGIIGAMEDEVALLKEKAEIIKTEEIAGMEFVEGTISGNHVVIVQCGMGKVNAGICAQTLISRFNASYVINTGAGGSLDNTLDIGDIVISTDAVQHDFDVSQIGFVQGEIPYTGLYAFPADETMQKKARKAVEETNPDVKCVSGRVCSGDQFIYSNEQKEKIVEDFGGLCAEMEGAAIAQVCYLNQVPYVIIRAISDKVDGSEEIEFMVFEKEAAEHCAAITGYMLEHWQDPTD